MKRTVVTLGGFIARRPAQLGGAVTAWIAVANPSPAVMAAAGATVAWLVGTLTSSKAAVAEAHEAGYNKAVADVSALSP